MTFLPALPLWFRRAARHAEAPVSTFTLLAGQRRDVVLAPGARLRVASGELTLSRPARWLGDALVAPAGLRLREGDGWTSADREIVTLVAHAPSRVLLADC